MSEKLPPTRSWTIRDVINGAHAGRCCDVLFLVHPDIENRLLSLMYKPNFIPPLDPVFDSKCAEYKEDWEKAQAKISYYHLEMPYTVIEIEK